jgi:hypothetical protein
MMTRKTPGWRRVLTAIALVGVVVGAGVDDGGGQVAQATQRSPDGLTEALRNDLQAYLNAHHA